jgi:hypothetical protein
MIVNILAYKDFYTTYVIWFNNLYKTVELPYLSGLRSRFLYANHCILKSNKRSNSTEMAAMKKKKRKMGNDKTTICKQIWTTCSIGLVAWNHRHSYQSKKTNVPDYNGTRYFIKRVIFG